MTVRKIVEVVRKAAREPTECFHLLDLEKLLAQRSSFLSSALLRTQVSN